MYSCLMLARSVLSIYCLYNDLYHPCLLVCHSWSADPASPWSYTGFPGQKSLLGHKFVANHFFSIFATIFITTIKQLYCTYQGMDAMARALLNAADIFIPEMLHTCYASFDSGAGKEFEEGKLNLERPRPSFPLFLSSSSFLLSSMARLMRMLSLRISSTPSSPIR